VEAPTIGAGSEDLPVAFGRDRRLPITTRWREHRSGSAPEGEPPPQFDEAQSREAREEKELS
jgi:hypothetical protein